MTYQFNLSKFKASLQALPPEDKAPQEKPGGGKYLSEPGEHVVFLTGLQEKNSKAGNVYYCAEGETESGAKTNVMLSMYNKPKDGLPATINVFTLHTIFASVNRVVPQGVLKNTSFHPDILAIVNELLQGPWKVKVSYDLPYVKWIEAGVYRIMDPKTHTPLVDADFSSKPAAVEAATKPCSEGGLLGLKLGDCKISLVCPAEGHVIPETILEALNAMEEVASGKELVVEPPPAPARNPFSAFKK